MAGIRIGTSLRGLGSVRSAFKALPDAVRERFADATEETAEQIRSAAARKVRVRYGFLQRHIQKVMSRRTGFAKVGVAKGRETLPDGRAVDPSMYARFVEFGTEHSQNWPFMIPAAEQQRRPHIERCRKVWLAVERDVSTIGSRLD